MAWGEYMEDGIRVAIYKSVVSAEDIFDTVHVHRAWWELDEEMGVTAESYGYKPAKRKK